MFKHKTWLVLLILALLQLGVLLYKIAPYYLACSECSDLRFRVDLLDPVDPLRGRYMQLRVIAPLQNCSDELFAEGRPKYAQLARGADALAKVVKLSFEKPQHAPYLELDFYASDSCESLAKNLHTLRFYVHEKDASALERALGRCFDKECVLPRAEVILRFRADHPLEIRGLELNGVPYRDYLRQHTFDAEAAAPVP